jgi:hypothetical protein
MCVHVEDETIWYAMLAGILLAGLFLVEEKRHLSRKLEMSDAKATIGLSCVLLHSIGTGEP